LIVLPAGARLRAYPIVWQAVRGEAQSFVSFPFSDDTYRVEPAPMIRPGATTRLTSNMHSSARRRRGERAIARRGRSITAHPTFSHGTTRGCSRRHRVGHTPLYPGL